MLFFEQKEIDLIERIYIIRTTYTSIVTMECIKVFGFSLFQIFFSAFLVCQVTFLNVCDSFFWAVEIF